MRLRRSLSLRVSLSIAAAVALTLGIVGGIMVSSIRNGLFDERIADIIADASFRWRDTQQSLDNANVSTQDQVQNAAWVALQGLRDPSAGLGGAYLDRSPTETSTISILPMQSSEYSITPSDELREALAENDGLAWQSIGIGAQGTRGETPGIIVGMRVNVQLAGSHELYLIYSLEREQRTLDVVTRTLAFGVGALVAVLGVAVWMIMWHLLRPVRDAAITAERLAAGLLDQRMGVKGEDELATLARSFNEMAESLQSQIQKLEELSRLQQRFVSDVSHELRTPMTTIRMASEMLHSARLNFDPAARRSAELLYNQLDRFESMLADLLEISRFDAGAAVLSPEEQDLRMVVHRVVEFAQPLAEQKGTEIRLRGLDAPATAAIDARRVDRIVRNLILNAIEHSDSRPVDVTLYDGESAVAVRVFDTGVGMSPHTAAHVFDRFWRADPARARTTGGTGLGLAIALEDARLHGGTLAAWGEEGVYTSFLLTLPKHVGEAHEPPAPLIPPELNHVEAP